jgi:hypothetical protein
VTSIERILADVPLPEVTAVRQRFERPRLDDVEGELRRRIRAALTPGALQGRRVAVGIGSRGMADLPLLVRTVVDELRAASAEPFVVPSMGSHGGATAAGQQGMLAQVGVTEASVGAPIRATMDTIEIGRTDGGLPVHLDAFATSADAIVVVNVVKPHVSFRGAHESGLMKMIAVGLGKQRGADVCHEPGYATVLRLDPPVRGRIRHVLDPAGPISPFHSRAPYGTREVQSSFGFESAGAPSRRCAAVGFGPIRRSSMASRRCSFLRSWISTIANAETYIPSNALEPTPPGATARATRPRPRPRRSCAPSAPTASSSIRRWEARPRSSAWARARWWAVSAGSCSRASTTTRCCRPEVWNLTESEHRDGRTRFSILKGGCAFEATGSEWLFDGGLRPPQHAAKLIRLAGGLERAASVGFRCAADLGVS